jgi:hypothetical protein
MNVSRRASDMANTTAPQRTWIRPAVQRLVAGHAENGGTISTDVGVSFS